MPDRCGDEQVILAVEEIVELRCPPMIELLKHRERKQIR
jgi:hypothetical protein